jgi:hypothetical protein
MQPQIVAADRSSSFGAISEDLKMVPHDFYDFLSTFYFPHVGKLSDLVKVKQKDFTERK